MVFQDHTEEMDFSTLIPFRRGAACRPKNEPRGLTVGEPGTNHVKDFECDPLDSIGVANIGSATTLSSR